MSVYFNDSEHMINLIRETLDTDGAVYLKDCANFQSPPKIVTLKLKVTEKSVIASFFVMDHSYLICIDPLLVKMNLAKTAKGRGVKLERVNSRKTSSCGSGDIMELCKGFSEALYKGRQNTTFFSLQTINLTK